MPNAGQLGTSRGGGGRVGRGCQGGLRLNLFSSTISGSHSMSGGRRRTLMFPKSLASHCSRLSVQPWKPKRCVSSGLRRCPRPPPSSRPWGKTGKGLGAVTKRFRGAESRDRTQVCHAQLCRMYTAQPREPISTVDIENVRLYYELLTGGRRVSFNKIKIL